MRLKEASCVQILKREIWYVRYSKELGLYLAINGKPLKGFLTGSDLIPSGNYEGWNVGSLAGKRETN